MDSRTILLGGASVTELRPWAAILEDAGFRAHLCDTRERFASKLTEGCGGIFVVLQDRNADEWLSIAGQVRNRFPWLKIAALAVESSEDLAVRALRAHVDEYFRAHESLAIVSAVKSLWRTDPAPTRHTILGESQCMRDLRARLDRLAAKDCNVLITGESGTGKELAAVTIHARSDRRSKPLVCINCAAIPEALVESELFGRERGAFTGADSAQDGKLKAADGGVVFLDEVGDLSLFAQAKILRAVETKEIFRLGSNKAIKVDARIVAATHRNLEEMVRQGLFRQDLYFRLNVGRVHMPTLHERVEDLGILIEHHMDVLNRQMGTSVTGLSDETWRLLARYSWPGNVRELKNLVESLLVNSVSNTIGPEDLPPQFRPEVESTPAPAERDELVSALLGANWNKSKAAEGLNWSRMRLYRKMKKYAISAAGNRVA